MNNLQPVKTVNSYVVNGYTGANYYDTIETYTLYSENKSIIVKNNNQASAIVGKITYSISDMCFIDTRRILVAAGNTIRVYHINSKLLIAQWTVNYPVTAVGIYDSLIIIITTHEFILYDSLDYTENQIITIDEHEKSYVSSNKLVLFSLDFAIVYNLISMNYIRFNSIGIPLKAQSYDSYSLLLTLENNIVFFNLYNGQTDIFLPSKNYRLFVSRQQEIIESHEDTLLYVGLVTGADVVKEISYDRYYDTGPRLFKDSNDQYRVDTDQYSVSRIGKNQSRYIKYNGVLNKNDFFVKHANTVSNRTDTIIYTEIEDSYGIVKYICKDSSIVICENSNQLVLVKIADQDLSIENSIDITGISYDRIVGTSDARQIILLGRTSIANIHLFTLDDDNNYQYRLISSDAVVDFEKLAMNTILTLSDDNKKLSIDYQISADEFENPLEFGIVQWDVGYGNLVNPVIHNLGIGPAGISYLFSSYSSKYIVTQDYSAIDGDMLSIFYKENNSYSKIASRNSLNLNPDTVNTDIGGDPYIIILSSINNLSFYKDTELTIAATGSEYAITISLQGNSASIKNYFDARLYNGNYTSGVVAYI